MSKNKLNLYGSLLKVTVKTAFFFLFLLFFLFLIKIFYVSADTVTTSVTVGNSAPVFTVEPYEDPASTVTTPTNVGSKITWRATATDSNGDDYYLIICSTSSVTPGSGGSAPTCTATTWCTSSATTTGTATSCQHTTKQEDAYSNDWYAFVCDKLASGTRCSDASQGTLSDGSESPFYVNHPPTFTDVSNNSPQNPGSKITWSTTASDSDLNQKVKLLVCKTAGITGAGTCSGDSWCTSNFVSSNPTCDYNISNPAPAGSHNAYVYIIDELNFPAVSDKQGSNVSFSINNVAPIVSSVSINGGSSITLNAGTTTNVTLTATVSDSNGCQDIDTVKGYAYRSSITYTGCDTSGEANANYCYPEISCAVVDSGNTCEGPADASAEYTCSVSLQYYADPTDTGTKFSGDTWLSTIKAIDKGTTAHSTQVSNGVTLNTLLAYEITGSISYDSLGVGEGNTLLNKAITTIPRGNTGLNQEHSGSDMCTNYPLCSGGTPIPVAKQKYALVASTSYSSGIALSTTPADVLIKVLKPTSGSPTTKSTWWGIEIPEGTLAGSYHGENTVTAVKSDPTDW